jgi:hypothetical protein
MDMIAITLLMVQLLSGPRRRAPRSLWLWC